MKIFTEEDMNLTDYKTSLDDIFEIAKYLYNIPNSKMTRDFIDGVAENLDYINAFYNYTILTQIRMVERLKDLATDKDTSTTLMRELNIELEKLLNIYNYCLEA